MLLQKGITGFFDRNSLPENDYLLFQQYCYAMRNFRLMRITRPDYASYFLAEFSSFFLLLNRYYPVAGCIEKLCPEKQFLDIKGIVLPDNYLVPAVYLNAVFDGRSHQLAEAELKQIRYWQPVSVGNIIFNEWD